MRQLATVMVYSDYTSLDKDERVVGDRTIHLQVNTVTGKERWVLREWVRDSYYRISSVGIYEGRKSTLVRIAKRQVKRHNRRVVKKLWVDAWADNHEA